nr:MAG TPA: hypothetical protein [Caudoviricetes sp.]
MQGIYRFYPVNSIEVSNLFIHINILILLNFLKIRSINTLLLLIIKNSLRSPVKPVKRY